MQTPVTAKVSLNSKSGVKALLPLPSIGVMLTGGKDGIVKQWDCRQLNGGHSSETYLAANFYDHIHWVNRLCYADNHDKCKKGIK